MLKQFIEKLFTPKPTYEELEKEVVYQKSLYRDALSLAAKMELERNSCSAEAEQLGRVRDRLSAELRDFKASIDGKELSELRRTVSNLRDELSDSELRREELEKALADSTATNNTLSATIRELCAGKVVSNG